MRPTIIFALALFALIQPLAVAQQAGENINVLPVVVPDTNGDGWVDDLDDSAWYLKGDGYLQRQVEPTIAASTLNPDHLLAFFVDYRAVDIADDAGLGEETVMIAAYTAARPLFMLASGLFLPELPRVELPPIAASEAWIGMSRSYDGGLTWSGGFLPGAPFDTGAGANLITPIDGLEAATDPVLAPGPCGKFYLVFMAFTRGGESKLVVTRYTDHNYAGGGEHIQWDGFMTVAESGNNAEYGYFLDKPDIEVDIARDPGAEICADQVNISYSTFNGFTNDGKFQSKINFAYSTDSAVTFTKQKLNPPYKQNQGSALAIDPEDGTIYMVWRHFNNPDAILMTKSVNGGVKWSKPVVVTESGPMAAFDQPSISVADALAVPATSPIPSNDGLPEVAFRSNGFPTATVTDDNKLFVAWQERVDEDGHPHEEGSPRIMVVHSDDRGASWKNIDGIVGPRRAVDMYPRDATNPPAPGFGALPQPRSSGSQVQPKIIFSGGQMLLAYYESRGRIANYGYVDRSVDQFAHEYIDTWTDFAPSAYTFITGYDRLVDFRAALLNPATGDLLYPGSTFQVSRYPIRADANLANGEDLSDVAPVNPECFPDSPDATELCVRQVNRFNATQSAWGGTPFVGDYPDVAAIVQFVYDEPNGRWRWATKTADVPVQGFHTIFTDNRHLIPATQNEDGIVTGDDQWVLSQHYDPPFEDLACDSDPDDPECRNKPGCVNAGSRNTDVLTSRIDSQMILSAPTTFKNLDHARGFPFTVKNTTGVTRTYNMTITLGADYASFVRTDTLVDPPIDNPVNDGGPIEIYANSSASLMVYVGQSYSLPVTVEVSEDCSAIPPEACTNASGSLTFNSGFYQQSTLTGPDTQFPTIEGEPEVQAFYNTGDPSNPFVINPFVINPFVINPFVINPFVINPFVINPFVINPFVINTSLGNEDALEAVIDTTWTVAPGDSSAASSYLPLVNIDDAQAFQNAGYSFQIIVTKGSTYGGIYGCDAVNVGQPQILANVYPNNPDNLNQNPFVINPFVINPFVINPFVINPFVINSTFTMAPPENDPDNPDMTDDETTKAPPPSNNVNITLRAFKFKVPPATTTAGSMSSTSGGPDQRTNLKLKDGPVYQPWLDPPSLVVVPLPCLLEDDPPEICDVVSIAPDLIPDAIDFTPPDAPPVRVGGTLAFPTIGDWAVKNQGYGDATAENGPLQHGFYLCPTVPAEGTELDITTCKEFEGPEQKHISEEDPLAKGLSEDFGPIELTIPTITSDTWPVGQFLVVYVDELRQVSEFNEVNNWTAFPINIDEPNKPPEIIGTSFETGEDTPLITSLSYLVSDQTSDSLEFTITDGPTSGTITPCDPATGPCDPPTGCDPATGDFTYTPEPHFNSDIYGDVFIDFTVSDGEFTVPATATITVHPDNDPPVAADDTLIVDQNSLPTIVDVLNNDTDPLDYPNNDGPLLTVIDVGVADNGLATLEIDGSVTYQPNTGYSGTDSFTYTVEDSEGGTATATVNVTINLVFTAWDFIGFDNPWETNYTMGVGSTIPLKWRYADPVTGQTVSSFSDPLPITATRYPVGCNYAGEPLGAAEGEPIALPGEDAGDSDLRYKKGVWQLNWDTANQDPGCYVLTIYHPITGQTDTQNADGENLTIVLQ